jgi:two-component system response regulator AtoC
VGVLIQGETGTGKSLLGRIIHGESDRRNGPFVVVNCAGIPESLFESEFFGHRRGAFTGAVNGRQGYMEMASGGTLFLDEVGELPRSQQAKLLTVLEDGEVRRLGSEKTSRVDVRVLAAGAGDVEGSVASGTFRRDLFHRLAVLRMTLPPLRDRPQDIPVLAKAFLRAQQRRHGLPGEPLSPSMVEHLLARDWPGNVRELAHALEATLILSGNGRLEPTVFLSSEWGVARPAPRSGGEGRSPGAPSLGRYSFMGSHEEEAALIRRTLEACHGNRTRAARELGMARNTLRAKMKIYGL